MQVPYSSRHKRKMKHLVCLILVSMSASFGSEMAPLETRIVGGEGASIQNYPYQLSLLNMWGRLQCGAVLITSEVALTAAHCHYFQGLITGILFELPVWYFKIRAGSAYNDRGGIEVGLKKFVIHPKFNRFTANNDIAILVLAQKLEFSNKIRPVPLPTGNVDLKEGLEGNVTGWGELQDGSYPVKLRVVKVPVVDFWTCKEAYALTDGQFCAGYDNGGRDSCQGDSGGPFVSQGVLLGIVSKGEGCGLPGFPGIYTKVSAYQDFISSIIV